MVYNENTPGPVPPGDPNYVNERKLVCDTCEENAGFWCKKCGCILPVKQRWKENTCPLNKWKQ